MIAHVRTIVAVVLYWLDIAMVGITGVAGAACLYMANYCWGFVQAYWLRLGFPWKDWDDVMKILGWVYTNLNPEIGLLALKCWLFTCATGFFVMTGVLGLHEAWVRLRVRLG